MTKLRRITDYLNFERDEFSLVDEQIIVWEPVFDQFGQIIGKDINKEKTRQMAKKWLEKNTPDNYPKSDIEKDADIILSWIKKYYEK